MRSVYKTVREREIESERERGLLGLGVGCI